MKYFCDNFYMAGIRISGLASGLPPNLVDQVIEAERMPVKSMQEKKTKIEDKVKLVQDFETKLSDITKNLSTMIGARGFTDIKMSSSFPDIITGTLDPDRAVPGEWNVEVTQLAGKPSVVTNGFPDRDETRVGVGYIRFNTAEGEKEIYIDQENSTLDKLAAKINDSGTGLRATVMNDRSDKDESFKLVLTGMKTGDDNEIEFPTIYMLDGEHDFQFASSIKSQNAKFKLDGQEFEVSDNLVKDVIPGVTLDLKRAQVGTPVRLNVTENHEAISDKIKGFVDAYNAALGFVQTQNKLTKDKQGNDRLGPLGGDSMLRMTESRLRSIIQDPQFTTSKYRRLIELGIEFSRTGTLNYNAEKFSKMVNTDPQGVAAFFRGDMTKNGFVPALRNKIAQILDPQTGTVTSRRKNYQEQVSQMDKRIEQKEKNLARTEESLRNKFAKMEESMSKIQSQGAASQASLGAIGGK